MIVGNGLMANMCRTLDKGNIIFFASGVSNSLINDPVEFKREEHLLLKYLDKYPNAVFVYFGTISQDGLIQTPYTIHKRKMCDHVVDYAKKHVILKLANVVGIGGNENTLFNFLKNKIKTGQRFQIYQGIHRSFIDINDVRWILQVLVRHPYHGVHNFYGFDPMLIEDIVQMMSEHSGKVANFELVNGEKDFIGKNSELVTEFTEHIEPEGYTMRLISKYF